MTSGIPGSAYEPHADTRIRLARWRRLAADGHHMDDIAAQLGMTRAALDKLLERARKHGHPDAIPHARSSIPGIGTWQLTGRARRRPTPPGGTT